MPLPLLFLALCGCHPEEGVPGGFAAADDVRHLDSAEGRVRVHYSDRGPNAADQSDQDRDDVPDRVEEVAALSEAALAHFEARGYAPPVTEADIGLGDLGGSDALDVYLLPVIGNVAGGSAAPDGCAGARCAVHLVVPGDDEDDRIASIDAVLAHELFHAVQAAYDYTEPAWLREGTASAMEGTVFSFASSGVPDAEYLARTACGLEAIDGVSRCAEAAYGAGLLWVFLDERLGGESVLHTIEATVANNGAAALAAGVVAQGSTLAEEWPMFAAWNLATGTRAGGPDPGYDNADRYDGLVADISGETVAASFTVAPLSARYLHVLHPGGPLWLGVRGDPGPLVVTVHPVVGGADDGPLDPMLGPFALPADGALELGDFPAGGVWLSVSHPVYDEGDVTLGVCVGAEGDVDPCVTASAGCASAGGPWWLGALAAAGVARRRRRSSR